MADHPISGIMGTAMEKIRELVDVNTIIGDPITISNGTIILPVSKVSFGFASGGSDLPTKVANKELFGGGTGAGVTISPIAFLIVEKDDVKLIQIQNNVTTADKIVEAIPTVVDKVKDMVNSRKKDEDEDSESEQDSEPLTVVSDKK